MLLILTVFTMVSIAVVRKEWPQVFNHFVPAAMTQAEPSAEPVVPKSPAAAKAANANDAPRSPAAVEREKAPAGRK